MGTFSNTVADAVLNAIARAASYSEAAIWVKLHTGDPGTDGTGSPAGNTTRQQGTFGTDATNRAISNTVAIEWTSVPSSETYSYVSLWDASTGGNFLGRDELSSVAGVTTGDTFRIPIGDCDLTFT